MGEETATAEFNQDEKPQVEDEQDEDPQVEDEQTEGNQSGNTSTSPSTTVTPSVTPSVNDEVVKDLEEDTKDDENILKFSDVSSNSWYFEAVKFVIVKDLFKGIDDYRFAPENNMSRAMIWTVLYRNSGETGETTGVNWYDNARKWVIEQLISDGENPNNDMTREELITMIYRYAGQPEIKTQLTTEYSDTQNISQWAMQAMNWALENEIILGKTSDNLAQKTQRQEQKLQLF